jgi:hypothetical protein
MKTYGRSGGIAPRILNLALAGGEWWDSRQPSFPLGGKKDRLAAGLVWTLWKRLSSAGRRIPIPQSFGRSLVAIPTELWRLYYITYGLRYFNRIIVTAAVHRTVRFPEHSTMNLVHFRNCDRLSCTETIHCLCPLFRSSLLTQWYIWL